MSGYYAQIPKTPEANFRGLVNMMRQKNIPELTLTGSGGEVLAYVRVPTSYERRHPGTRVVRMKFTQPANRHYNRKMKGLRRRAVRQAGLPAKRSYRSRHKRRKTVAV